MNQSGVPHEFRGQHEWEGERLASPQRFIARVQALEDMATTHEPRPEGRDRFHPVLEGVEAVPISAFSG